MVKPLTVEEIQKCLDAMPAEMNAKGLREPRAELTIRGNVELQGLLNWADKRTAYGSKYEWVKGKSTADILRKMHTLIANLPSQEEARMKEFMGALSDVIELGRKSGIEVDFVNPLVDTMRRLSANILTDQREVA